MRDIPTTRLDVDGHDDWLRVVWDATTGMVRGTVASASYGAVRAPESGDSVMSLWGQSVGSAMVGQIGAQMMVQGGAEAGAGLIALVPTEGRSGGEVLEGGAEFVAGGALTFGAAKNSVAVISAMAGKGGPPNPDGSKGASDHQQKVNELVDKANGEAKAGETVESNKQVKGVKYSRRPDAQIVNTKGQTRKVFEAERRPNSARNKKREAEYKKLKLENETHLK